MGISELFTAPKSDAAVILAVWDPRLKRYLLGFGELPAGRRDLAGHSRFQ